MKQRLLTFTLALFLLPAAYALGNFKTTPANNKQHGLVYPWEMFTGNPDGYCKSMYIWNKKYMVRLSSGLDYVISIQDWYSGSYCTNISAFITIVQDDDYFPIVQLDVIFDDPYYDYWGGMYHPEINIMYQGTETYNPWGFSE